ncbi:MAG TPA: cytochrome ubiquinol oxidase subunit I, partial [Amycolatopsis sp.]|uniref:cytochrome ubiquinol oxidase subunit I n=1 Tax=Amycolatopsis sp. TaxID=37632 RepID=UPI002F40323A
KRTTEVEFFRRSMRVGVVAALIGSFLVIEQGFAQFGELAKYQPDKLKHGDVGLPLGLMINLGFVMFLCALLGGVLLIRNWITKARFLHYLMVAAIPLPFAAAIMGWLVRELGRQPWLVWGKLRTADAIADVPAGQILFSFIAFSLLFAALAVADWVLMARVAKRGPEPVEEPAERPVLSGV